MTASAIPLLVTFLCLLGAAHSQTLKVALVGSGGGPAPDLKRFGPSILVQAGTETLLFDCGRGATQRLSQLKVPLADVTALFVTHLHSDHVIGIPDLWLTGWVLGRRVPLRVWGPRGTRKMMHHLEVAFEFDVHVRRDLDEMYPGSGAQVVASDIEEGVVYQRNGVKVTAFRVDHGPVKPAFGYRVDYAGRSVALSGDTRFSENLIRFAQGVDVLIHEAENPEAFRAFARHTNLTAEQVERIIAHHTPPEQAGEVFARVKPKLAVYAHAGEPEELIPDTRKKYSGPLEVGEDLMTIEIGSSVSVHKFE